MFRKKKMCLTVSNTSFPSISWYHDEQSTFAPPGVNSSFWLGDLGWPLIDFRRLKQTSRLGTGVVYLRTDEADVEKALFCCITGSVALAPTEEMRWQRRKKPENKTRHGLPNQIISSLCDSNSDRPFTSRLPSQSRGEVCAALAANATARPVGDGVRPWRVAGKIHVETSFRLRRIGHPAKQRREGAPEYLPRTGVCLWSREYQ